ncbi:MAG: hypothetical protein LQ345_006161, partial [Seirophora villosa]
MLKHLQILQSCHFTRLHHLSSPIPNIDCATLNTQQAYLHLEYCSHLQELIALLMERFLTGPGAVKMGGEEAQARLLWDSGLRPMRWKLVGLEREVRRLLYRERTVLRERAKK